jgi:hypothetical protein
MQNPFLPHSISPRGRGGTPDQEGYRQIRRHHLMGIITGTIFPGPTVRRLAKPPG